MRAFSGFPSGKVKTVSIPEPFFADLMPMIDDLGELKLTLYALWRLSQQRGEPPFLRFADLASDTVLLSGLGEHPTETLHAALSKAVERGTLLQARAPDGGPGDDLYFANTPKGRAAVEAIAGGDWPEETESAGRPNIFTLYEQNIGLLTPLIAEELREAEHTYPTSWIEDAFREAVSLNKRSWKYILAILLRWQSEGKDEGRDSRSPEADRRRYLEWKHGKA
ncbi:MAG: DnaD domain protein [Anaerolineae bacterium]|jgi:DnaD/phage-associated family protein